MELEYCYTMRLCALKIAFFVQEDFLSLLLCRGRIRSQKKTKNI